MFKYLSAAIGLVSSVLGIIQFFQEPQATDFQLKNSSLALSTEAFSLEDPVGRFQVVMNKVLDSSSTSKHFKDRKELSVSLDYSFLGSVNLCFGGFLSQSLVECNRSNVDYELFRNVLNTPLPNGLTSDLEISYSNQTDNILKSLLSQRNIVVNPKSKYHLSCRVDLRINADYTETWVTASLRDQKWSDKELYSCELQRRNKVIWSGSESMTIEKRVKSFAKYIWLFVLGLCFLGMGILNFKT